MNDETSFIDENGEMYHYSNGFTMLVYDYYSNSTLYEYFLNLRNNSSSIDQIRKIFKKLLKTINYLKNELNLVHLNLEIDNIYLDHKLTPVLGNLVNLKQIELIDRQQFTHLKTEKFYCPPEIFNDDFANLDINIEKVEVF